MSTRVLFIRHATTPKVGKGLTGWTPGVSLDDAGREQARSLVGRLESVPIDAIYSSPLERTRETAAPLSSARKIAVIEKKEFGEVHFGNWQGKDFPEIELDPRWKSFNAYRSGTPAPDGEMMLETQARIVRGVLDTVSSNPDRTIAIFSHADAIKSFIFHLLGIPIDFHMRVDIAPVSVSTVDFYPDLPVLRGLNSLA